MIRLDYSKKTLCFLNLIVFMKEAAVREDSRLFFFGETFGILLKKHDLWHILTI